MKKTSAGMALDGAMRFLASCDVCGGPPQTLSSRDQVHYAATCIVAHCHGRREEVDVTDETLRYVDIGWIDWRLPSGINPRPCVARIAVHRLVLPDRHDLHCRHSGV